MIKNEATKYLDDEKITGLRGAFEHRATWLYFLLKHAKEKGLQWDDFSRDAVRECGHYHGKEKIIANCPKYEDFREFFKAFISEDVAKVLELEVIEKTEDKLYMDFHYCPLVTAWQKLGCTQEEIEQLCDIAMEGDRGVAETLGFDFEIKSKIAEGANTCRIDFNKKK